MNPYVKRNSMEVKISSLINKHLNSRFLGDRIIAISKEVQESYRTIMHVPQGNIQRIYHGIDARHFHPPTKEQRLKARTDFELTLEEKVICLIGRLSPFKGHKVLLEAISQLQSEKMTVTALCAGTGEYKQNICQYAEDLGISESVKMLGFADSRKVLWASDVIVLPQSARSITSRYLRSYAVRSCTN